MFTAYNDVSLGKLNRDYMKQGLSTRGEWQAEKYQSTDNSMFK